MTNFAYISGIPATNNNPSDDQPDMMDNNDNSALIWETDHIGFNAPNGGLHQQNSYPAFSNGVVPVGDDPNEGSVAFSAAGEDDITRAQYFFKNVNMTAPLSALKVFGVFIPLTFPTTGPINPLNHFNMAAPVAQTSVNLRPFWTITINPNVLSSTNAAIFVQQTSVSAGSPPLNPNNLVWALTSPTTLTITPLNITSFPLAPISFQILQI